MQTLTDEDAYHRVLLSLDTWKKALSLKFPEEYGALERAPRKRTHDQSERSEEPHEEALLVLSKRALEGTSIVISCAEESAPVS
jgi:hypothetical protein